ncbi:MAG: DUF4416 family protein [Anaerolineae bacterium]|nr:DUF4416 family protein [Anaerolineae bacterium]
MGTARQPEPVRLIVGLLARDRELLSEATRRLAELYGPIADVSDAVPFTHTAYYAAELGERPWRQFLSFERLIDPGQLAAIKAETNALEQEWARGGPRPVNLDPGYVSLSKLVLATTKNHWHRIYLGQGIYAEVTLPFRRGAFEPQEWTYPDYRTEAHLSFFARVRERYRLELRELARGREKASTEDECG